MAAGRSGRVEGWSRRKGKRKRKEKSNELGFGVRNTFLINVFYLLNFAWNIEEIVRLRCSDFQG